MTSATTGDTLRSLIFTVEGGTAACSVLDQLLLPHETKYVPLHTVEDAWDAIRSMRIRGAPLIALVAVLGLAVDLTAHAATVAALAAADDARALVCAKMEYLKTSRPTAVNLFNALAELRAVVDAAPASAPGVVAAVLKHAQFMLARDVADNRAIGDHGADDLLARHLHPEGVRLVTICNTGALATAGWGTALGVARALHARGRLRSIAALETRPYNQGSRLTAYELLTEGMPGTLLCDSMAAAYLKTRGADACVVGADRVCANGDTANKIGTLNLAIVAKELGVEFFVASPFTTLDVTLARGDLIEIEERPAAEVVGSGGAPEGMPCWNPAFDVTPAKYITGIVTEKGVLRRSADGTLDVAGFVKRHSA